MDGRRTINLDLLAGLNQSTLIACPTPSSRTARRHPLPTNPPKKRWELRLCVLASLPAALIMEGCMHRRSHPPAIGLSLQQEISPVSCPAPHRKQRPHPSSARAPSCCPDGDTRTVQPAPRFLSHPGGAQDLVFPFFFPLLDTWGLLPVLPRPSPSTCPFFSLARRRLHDR